MQNDLPPTSVIIQSGIARLTIAKTSAAMNNVPDMTVSLSIAAIAIQYSELTYTPNGSISITFWNVLIILFARFHCTYLFHSYILFDSDIMSYQTSVTISKYN